MTYSFYLVLLFLTVKLGFSKDTEKLDPKRLSRAADIAERKLVEEFESAVAHMNVEKAANALNEIQTTETLENLINSAREGPPVSALQIEGETKSIQVIQHVLNLCHTLGCQNFSRLTPSDVRNRLAQTKPNLFAEIDLPRPTIQGSHHVMERVPKIRVNAAEAMAAELAKLYIDVQGYTPSRAQVQIQNMIAGTIGDLKAFVSAMETNNSGLIDIVSNGMKDNARSRYDELLYLKPSLDGELKQAADNLSNILSDVQIVSSSGHRSQKDDINAVQHALKNLKGVLKEVPRQKQNGLEAAVDDGAQAVVKQVGSALDPARPGASAGMNLDLVSAVKKFVKPFSALKDELSARAQAVLGGARDVLDSLNVAVHDSPGVSREDSLPELLSRVENVVAASDGELRKKRLEIIGRLFRQIDGEIRNEANKEKADNEDTTNVGSLMSILTHLKKALSNLKTAYESENAARITAAAGALQKAAALQIRLLNNLLVEHPDDPSLVTANNIASACLKLAQSHSATFNPLQNFSLYINTQIGPSRSLLEDSLKKIDPDQRKPLQMLKDELDKVEEVMQSMAQLQRDGLTDSPEDKEVLSKVFEKSRNDATKLLDSIEASLLVQSRSSPSDGNQDILRVRAEIGNLVNSYRRLLHSMQLQPGNVEDLTALTEAGTSPGIRPGARDTRKREPRTSQDKDCEQRANQLRQEVRELRDKHNKLESRLEELQAQQRKSSRRPTKAPKQTAPPDTKEPEPQVGSSLNTILFACIGVGVGVILLGMGAIYYFSRKSKTTEEPSAAEKTQFIDRSGSVGLKEQAVDISDEFWHTRND